MPNITERDFEDFLAELVCNASEEGVEIEANALQAVQLASNPVDTFEARGLLTRNHGLVVRFANGAEFQVQIVRSERGDVEDCSSCGEELSDKRVAKGKKLCRDCEEELQICQACGAAIPEAPPQDGRGEPRMCDACIAKGGV